MTFGRDDGPINRREGSGLGELGQLTGIVAEVITIAGAVYAFVTKAPPLVCLGLGGLAVLIAIAMFFRGRGMDEKPRMLSRPAWLGITMVLLCTALGVTAVGFVRVHEALSGTPRASGPASAPATSTAATPSTGSSATPSDGTTSTVPVPHPSGPTITLARGHGTDVDGGGDDVYMSSGWDPRTKKAIPAQLNGGTGAEQDGYYPIYPEDADATAEDCRNHSTKVPKNADGEWAFNGNIQLAELARGAKICLLTRQEQWAFLEVKAIDATHPVSLTVWVTLVKP